MNTTSNINELDHRFAQPTVVDGVKWYDLRAFGIEGQGWADTEQPFDRWPLWARGVLRDPVWELGQRCAGLRARFVTDATSLAAQWTVRRSELALSHMPATGASGLDLYAMDAGRWRFAGVGRPNGMQNQVTLVSQMESQPRQFLLYLPLYNGIETIRIGVPEGSTVTKPPPYPVADPRPICFYGTSINQGGCASRPGMCHIAILHRRLNRPVINLGFGGNARCEPEVASLLAELDPCCYVIDPLCNMREPMITERLGPLVRTLRQARPNTPILLIGSIEYQDGWLNPARALKRNTSDQAMVNTYHALLREGITNLHHMVGSALLGDDGEATVDGTHPTDAGFLRMADQIEPVLRRLLA